MLTFVDILLAGCFVNVQNIRKNAISQHRASMALKKSATIHVRK